MYNLTSQAVSAVIKMCEFIKSTSVKHVYFSDVKNTLESCYCSKTFK